MGKRRECPPPELTAHGYQWPAYIQRRMTGTRQHSVRTVMAALLDEEGLPSLLRMLKDADLPAATRLRIVEFLTDHTVPPLATTTLDAELDVTELPVPQIVIESTPPETPDV